MKNNIGYKELATIMGGNEPVSFIMYDVEKDISVIMSMEEVKELAAAGRVDTLGFEDGRFIPKAGAVEGPVKKLLMRKAEKSMSEMDLRQFVDHDCQFREQDIRFMGEHPEVVLISPCAAFKYSMGDISFWQITVGIFASHEEPVRKLKAYFDQCGQMNRMFRGAAIYGNMMMANIPMEDMKTGFDLTKIGRITNIRPLFNTDVMGSLIGRTRYIISQMPIFMELIMRRALPNADSINWLKIMLCHANRHTYLNLDTDLPKELR